MRHLPLVLACAGATAVAVAVATASLNGQERRADQSQDGAAPVVNDALAVAYGVGFYVGEDIRRGLEADGMNLDPAVMARGFADAVRGGTPAIEREKLDAVLAAVHREMARMMVERRRAEDPAFDKLCTENLERSQAFVESFAAKPGATKLDDGIYYIVEHAGSGPKPTPTDTIVADYTVTAINGRVVDQASGAVKRVRDMLAGPATVVQQMPAGSRWKVVFSPERAHGVAGDPPLIGPNEALVAVIELKEVRQ